MNRSVGVVIPVYNEEDYILNVLKRMPRFVSEIIIVDDGSVDKTAEISKRFDVKVIRHGSNMGKGAAMKTGFNHCDSDIVVIMDGDMQHDPALIGEFVEPIINLDCDLVVGNRFCKGFSNTPLANKVSNYIVKLIFCVKCKRKFQDILCGYRAIKRDEWYKLGLESNGFEIETEMLVKAVKNGTKISTVGIDSVYLGKKSKTRFSDIFSVLKIILTA